MAIKSLNEIIKFNNSFKTSINLYLSLNKAEKVLSYIPTKSSVNFLDGYMQATINNKEQATLLVGPYGKGKSHLLLVLLAILSMERTGENTQIIEELADKISAVDELGEQAASDVKLLWNKNRFLPVIINDTTGDLNQAFLLALNDALKREKLVDLAPDTYYSIALNRIEDWQENYPETYHDFITELKSIGIEHKEFIYELKRYSRTALDTFISVYPKITSGSIFNPLAVSEVLPLYKSVSERLVEDYGFSGIYIVFDEFSKFIEGLTDGNVGNNMKLLQDMCELATDSSNAKIFITMIAHKSIKEYGKYLSSDIINAFTGIEGRIVEKHFVTSSKNNYELVSHAIIKNSRALGQIPNAGKIVGPTALENYYQLPVFNCNFERKDFDEIILKGCYPLNPLATYLLLNISEKVAQNERTLFTFISNDEPNSMARYVLDHDKSKDWVIGADLIYDYFSGLFKKDVNNEFIHNIWLGAEVALSKCSSEDERKVIKAMAVIQIVNKEDEVLANETYLSLAVRLREGTSVLEALTQKNIIYRKKSTGAYVYKTQAGIELRTEIKKLKEIKGNNVNYGKALLDINSAYYVVPRKYNATQIAKCLTKDKRGKTVLSEKGKRLALQRSRLVAGASGKIQALEKYIMPYIEDKHILVYCGATTVFDGNQENMQIDNDEIRQIDLVTDLLGNKLHMKVSQFTSKENVEERNILKREFADGSNLQALIAIKCLDEGVNIPKIKTAFILASTNNPKEYIQRRGRVLRLAEGKDYAEIYDFITLPRKLDEVTGITEEQMKRELTLVKNELCRAEEFARIALNSVTASAVLDDIRTAYDLQDYIINYEEEFTYGE